MRLGGGETIQKSRRNMATSDPRATVIAVPESLPAETSTNGLSGGAVRTAVGQSCGALTQVVILRRPLIFRSRLRQLLPGIRTALLSIESLVCVHVPLHRIASPQAAPLGSLPS